MILTSSGSMGYGIDHADKYGGFVPRLVNPNIKKATAAFYYPPLRFIWVVSGSLEDELDHLDTGHPTQEFITALNDNRAEDKPMSLMLVEELGRNVLLERDSIDGSKKRRHRIDVYILERSEIDKFAFLGFDSEAGRYVYKVWLDNGHVFNLTVKSDRQSEKMERIEFAKNGIFIDGVLYDFFSKDDQIVSDIKAGGDYNERLFEHIKFLMKIYFSKSININLDRIEMKSIEAQVGRP